MDVDGCMPFLGVGSGVIRCHDHMLGTILFCRQPSSILFYPSSIYSNVSVHIFFLLGLSSEPLFLPMHVATPTGDFLVVDQVYRSCVMTI